MRGHRGGGESSEMEDLFKYVWLMILVLLYFNLWQRVLEDIRTVKKWYKLKEVYGHLSPFSKKWILGHIVFFFLWSYGEWSK